MSEDTPKKDQQSNRLRARRARLNQRWEYNPIFNLGRIVATPEAMRLLGPNVVDVLISHADLEQGELGDEDHNLNVQAVEVASRIFSKFKVDGASFYVITEWDRSLTTVLLPEEY